MNRTYIETDRPIVGEEITAEQALNIIMGRDPDGRDDGEEIPEEN